MEPRDVLNPRVFLCKAGRFVENVGMKNIGPKKDDPPLVQETFINDDFQKSCDEHDIKDVGQQLGGSGSSSGSSDDCTEFTDNEQNAEVVNAQFQKCKNQTQLEGSGSGAGEEGSGEADDTRPQGGEDFPILVFEGLEKPREGQMDKELVIGLLSKSTNISAMSVRRVVRLPMSQESTRRSLVLVEVDTIEHENEIILRKSKLKSNRSNFEIRKAKFRELWNYIEELSVWQRMDISSNTNNDGSIGDGDGVVVGSDGVDTTTEKLKPLFKSTTTTTTSRTTTTTEATTTPSVATTVATTAGSEQKESQSQPRKLKHLGRWSKILFF